MQRDRAKHEKAYLFSFNNSVRNSYNATPESSNNVSFQMPFTSSLKSLSTEPFSLLHDPACPDLFRSNNKQNKLYPKDSTRSKGMGMVKHKAKQNSDAYSSHKKPSRPSASKDRLRPALIERSIQNLPGFKFDIGSSVETQMKSPKSVVSLKTNGRKAKRQQSIKVFVRLKPLEGREREVVQMMNEKTLKIEDSYYCFDQVFQADTTQSAIFDGVGSQMCQQLYEGFNGTIFAYGQTGSGKTYTIFGEESLESYGLIYRCIRQILEFKRSHGGESRIKCSMVELYKEQLIDMFGGSSDLKLKEHKNGEVYIEGLREVYIQNELEMMTLVKGAAKGRKVTSTRLNEESSRSHTILSIYLEKNDYTTKLRLIDLAGSEKVCKSGAQGEAFEETKKINYSLSCLGNVINALTTRNKSDHIPFRDSKLTRLLKDSLTGNFLTSVIVNCATSEQFLHETISSLKFAERTKKIKVNVQSLEEEFKEKQTVSQLHSIIRKLQSDLDVTTIELKKYKQKQGGSPKEKEKPYHPRQILINIPLNKCWRRTEEETQLPTQHRDRGEREMGERECREREERCQTGESQLTARNPIPSERACVDENIRRYNEKAEWKPQQCQTNGFLLPDFSSLNVSKSIRRLENSPDISSLSFKYDESPDVSLDFSIQGESGRRQVLLDSPS